MKALIENRETLRQLLLCEHKGRQGHYHVVEVSAGNREKVFPGTDLNRFLVLSPVGRVGEGCIEDVVFDIRFLTTCVSL